MTESMPSSLYTASFSFCGLVLRHSTLMVEPGVGECEFFYCDGPMCMSYGMGRIPTPMMRHVSSASKLHVDEPPVV